MATRKRSEVRGSALAFVTTTVQHWTPIFNNRSAAHIALNTLKGNLERFHVSAVGYVLMPSHVHLLLGFPDIRKLSKFMQTFKILTSKGVRSLPVAAQYSAFWQTDGFRLWQPRFDDLIIVSERQFKIKLDYIHDNPVRAGLVAKSDHWQYSSAADWLGLGVGPIPIDKHFSYLG